MPRKNIQEALFLFHFLDGMNGMEESKKWDIERIASERLLSMGASSAAPVSVGCKMAK